MPGYSKMQTENKFESNVNIQVKMCCIVVKAV